MDTLICRVICGNAGYIMLALEERLGTYVKATPVPCKFTIPTTALIEGYQCWAFTTNK